MVIYIGMRVMCDVGIIQVQTRRNVIICIITRVQFSGAVGRVSVYLKSMIN
jgi:hypothetical protein